MKPLTTVRDALRRASWLFTTPVTLLSPAESSDGMGGVTQSWTPVATLPGLVDEASAQTRLAFEIQPTLSARVVYVRGPLTITMRDAVEIAGLRYRVISVEHQADGALVKLLVQRE